MLGALEILYAMSSAYAAKQSEKARNKITNYGVADGKLVVLNDGDELEGGDMLFMDENGIVEIPNQNNLMVGMPTYISHSITPLKSKSGKDVAFTQQRFSIQYWVKCN